MAPKVVRDDLVDLEDRLLDEGFQFLLSILPQDLFQLSNQGGIIINNDLFPGDKESPFYAYVRKQDDAPDGIDVRFCRIYDTEIAAFKKVPPLSWHETQDSDYLRSPECRDHSEALIKYFLLLWASNQPYDGPLPQPKYKHLVAALNGLMMTDQYKSGAVIHEDAYRTDVQMNFRYLGLQSDDDDTKQPPAETEVGHSARASKNKKDTRLPTPHQSPRPSDSDMNMIDSVEDSTREASVGSAVGAVEPATAQPIDTDTVMTLATEELELVRQSLPTPDTLMEETVVETDPTLRDLQKKLGFDPSSHLPSLKSCTFREIHTDDQGYLSLRLLLGTLRDPPDANLNGAELWASFKMHDRNDRAAPRMHVHAFDADSDEVISDDLKIKDILPFLRQCTAFDCMIPGGDRAEELLLKALVKYYYIIAARDKLLGFDKHKMPYNDSFAEQLKIAVKRLQTQDASKGEEPITRRGYKRIKRSHNPTPTAALSDAEDDTPAVLRTREAAARRSGRRTNQPSSAAVSAAVSDEEDAVPPPPPPSKPKALPPKLALGTRITTGVPAVNEFLDPDAEPADSDGDSGDEIPGHINPDVVALIQKRYDFQRQAKNHYEVTKGYAKKKEGVIMGIRKVKGMLKKHEYEPEVRARQERDLEHRHVILGMMQTHLAFREQTTAAWKKRVKEFEVELQRHPEITDKMMTQWHALYKREDF